MRIVHFADVHIRSLSRHDECRHVTEEFVKKLNCQHVDHIYVGGDLFHTKTQNLSPEYIDFMHWWLLTLVAVAPLHIILGNHDGNLVNSSRQDAVSPIVTMLKHPDIHLYKKSGVYEFTKGFNWCVFSLFDVDGWKNVRPVPGYVNIACYHGPVKGASSDTGWKIDDGLSVDFFNGYTCAMLGDIHSHQFLSFRDVEMVIDESELEMYPDATVIEIIDG